LETIRLYSQPTNPFSEKVARALIMKRLDCERVEVSDPTEVRRLSPVTQKLPVLEIGSERRAGSDEILGWLEDRYPEPSLYSSDPQVRQQQQRLAEWSDTSFLWYWDRWRQARFPRPGDEKPPAAGLLDKLRGHLGQRTSPSRVELRELEVIDELAHRMDDLVGFLGNRPFFHADEPSAADITVCGMLTIVRDGPMEMGAEELRLRPVLLEYMERVEKQIKAPA
jgi:glutathione S-transferase